MTEFERETCSRCGGCGKYSYNQIHGDMCYGCYGKGTRLTKKGSKASEYFKELLLVDNTDLKVGDYIWYDSVPGFEAARWRKIVDIEEEAPNPNNHSYVGGVEIPQKTTFHLDFGRDNNGRSGGIGGLAKDSKSKRYPQDEEGNSTKEAFRAMKKKAFDYQSTLTKQGKVAKKFKKLGGG